jgi:leucyl aminopeptidase
MDIAFVAASEAVPARAAVARIVFEGETPADLARALAASRFTGAKGQTLDILAPEGSAVDRLVLIGAGKKESFDATAAEHAAAAAYNAVKASGLVGLRIECGAGREARGLSV